MIKEELTSLHEQLQTHKKSLEQVDSSIKRLNGSEDSSGGGKSLRGSGERRVVDDDDIGDDRKKSSLSSKVVRLNKSLDNDDEERRNRNISSGSSSVNEALSYKRKLSENEERRVVRSRQDDQYRDLPRVPVVAKNIQSKDELIKLQSKFSGSEQRNKRILGVILGTLKQFKTDDSERSSTVQALSRKELEKKVEVRKVEESKKIAEERKRLEREKHLQTRLIRILEDKIALAENFELWKKNQSLMKSAIRTKAKPEIFYKPRSVEGDEKLRAMRDTCASQIEDEIKTRQKMVDVEIEALNQESASLQASLSTKKQEVEGEEEGEVVDEEEKKSVENDNSKDIINLEESEVRLGEDEEIESAENVNDNDSEATKNNNSS